MKIADIKVFMTAASETLGIAAKADAFSIRFTTHNYNSMTIGLAGPVAAGTQDADGVQLPGSLDRLMSGNRAPVDARAMKMPLATTMRMPIQVTKSGMSPNSMNPTTVAATMSE